jgi:hypothetical protein
MKKTLSLCLAAFSFVAASAQNAQQLKQLEAERKFLASTDVVYPYIDTSPGYLGGNEKWTRYVNNAAHMKAAIEKAKQQSIPDGSYTVIVKFAVNADSTVGDAKVISKPVGFGLEEAALQLVKESGKWIPAHIEGKHQRSYLQVPVRFAIYRK